MIKKFTTPANLPAPPMRWLILLILVLFSFSSHAQQFDWVTGGGTTANNSNLQIYAEATYYMTTDANGNVYALSNVGNNRIYADTFYRSQGAYGADANILLTSYTCTGQMRWAKLIASSAGQCYSYGIIADSLGHIDIAAFVTDGTLHIGYDTSISGLLYEHVGLLQYDTSGHFNWIRYVGPNTTNTYSQTGGVYNTSALALGANNIVHLINYIGNGVVLMPGDTSHYGTYDLAYNPSGTLLNAKRLGMDSVWEVSGGVIDQLTGKLYVCGRRNQGLVTTFCSYAAAFDTNRNAIWMDTALNSTSAFSSIVYDKMGHLYFNGSAADASTSGHASFSFNGDSVLGSSIWPISVVMKTDTNGHPMWMQVNKILDNGTNIYDYNTLTLLPNNLIVSAGYFGTTLVDGIHSISVAGTGVGQNPFLSVLDTSGVPMSLVQLYGDGFYDWSTSIASDKVGNVYIGGRVEDSIYAMNGSAAIPAYHSVGGNSDFFVMKYGMDCGCTSMPVANFSVSGPDTARTRNFTYTGTTANVDSMVWSRNDTTVFAHGSTATRTFDTGSYEICVTVYTPCGNDMHCSRITVKDTSNVGVNNVTADNIQVYPNPSQNELTVSNAETGSSLIITNIVGQQVFNAVINSAKQTIDVSALPDGSYILQVTKNDGSRFVQKFVIAR